MILRRGLRVEEIDDATHLYWQAFGGKLGRLLRPSDRALQLIRRSIRPDHAFAAYDTDGRLIGLAGFKDRSGAFLDPSASDFRAVYGNIGGAIRAMVLNRLVRDIENQRLLVDGICVAPHDRGQGVGTALLERLAEHARDTDATGIRLEVADTNPRAQALYARQGYHIFSTSRLGLLSCVFGFASSTTMVRNLA